MTHTATVPVIIDVNSDGGFDPLGRTSCANMQQYFPADDSNEIILHFQVSFANSFCFISVLALLIPDCFASGVLCSYSCGCCGASRNHC